jgi:hypothetical protein
MVITFAIENPTNGHSALHEKKRKIKSHHSRPTIPSDDAMASGEMAEHAFQI